MKKKHVLPPSEAAKNAISAFMRAEADGSQQIIAIGYILNELCNINDAINDLDDRDTQRLLGRRDVALALMEISGRHQQLRFVNDDTK